MKSRREPFACPVCGEEVSPNARACPECGACDKSGWSGEAGDVLPDDDFDYDKFISEEFGSGTRRAGAVGLWWVIALVLLLAFLALMFVR